MSVSGALLLAAATASAAPSPQGTGAQLAGAQVRAVILEPAIVRQASGPVPSSDGPRPRITRREGTVLVEYQ